MAGRYSLVALSPSVDRRSCGRWPVGPFASLAADSATTLAAGSTFELDTRTVVVLQEHAEPEAEPDHSVAASVAALSQATASPAADQRSGSRPTKAPDA